MTDNETYTGLAPDIESRVGLVLIAAFEDKKRTQKTADPDIFYLPKSLFIF